MSADLRQATTAQKAESDKPTRPIAVAICSAENLP
jgi:hypothetical protein